MKKIFNKLPMMLIMLVMLLAFSIPSFAATTDSTGVWTYELGANGLTITGYNGNSATVTIPSTIDGYKVGAIGKQAFANNTTIRTLTIPETITSIGPEAFYNCYGLSQLYFNAKNCTIPDIWRYDGNKGVGVFSGAGSAATSFNVTFGAGVTDIPKNLFNTDYENGYGYAHITSITFSSGTKTIGDYAFEDCLDLQKVVLGSNITTIGESAFDNCTSIKTVTFKDKLTTIKNSAFENCTNLTSITWGTGLDSIGAYAFKGCTSLQAAHIPTPTTVIGRQAFCNATSLKEITIPTSVTSLNSEAFYGTISLSKITFSAKNCTVPDIWRYDDNKGVGVFSGAGSAASKLEVIFTSSVTTVPNGLFNTDRENGYPYAYVTGITFNSSVKEIGNYAFQNCENLSKLVLGTGVNTIGEYAFNGCTGLQTVTFRDKLATINTSAFENCTNLTSITWGKGLDTIGKYAFKGCTSLKAANIPTPTTTICNQAFANTTSLTTLTIPSSVTSIGAEAFYNTTKLAKINFNAKNCTVPSIWRYDDNRGVGVFSGAGSGCSSLTVTFGSTVVTIPANLFNTDKENGYDYAYVTSISIPSSVKEIGNNAFEDCFNLKTVTCKRTSPVLGTDVFKNCPTSAKFNCYYGGTVAAFAKEYNYKYSYLTPTKPEINSISNTSKGVKITWTASSGASKYYIYRKTSASGKWVLLDYVKPSVRSFVDDEATAGKTYYYTVKAYAPGGLYSSYDKTGHKIEFLKAPKNLKLTNKASGIYVDWDASTGAEKYLVYRKKGNGNYKKIATVSNTYYYDKTATTNGSAYSYYIYAYDSGSKSNKSVVKSTYRLSNATLTSVASSSSGKLTVKWSKNIYATGYQIQYSTNSSFSNAKTLTVSGKSTVSKTISNLTKNKKYYVRVRACKNVSGSNYYSKWSSSLAATIKK